jgi:formylglycine-generating enzyme required for sulfatase activity
MSDTKKPCCTPSRDVSTAAPAPQVRRGEVRRPSTSLPGGPFLMGTDYADGFASDGEGPVRPVLLSPFEIDTFPVTNDDFATFVEDTGHVTTAERLGSSFVFHGQGPNAEAVLDSVAAAPWWLLVAGASWRFPEGPGSTIADRGRHPVVHVSWDDASAYAAWSGGRLPTEAQWEYAARGGLTQALYPWGDELTPGGRHLCNIWQGEFPAVNTAEDGYAFTCPVDAFPPNGYGLYSMVGNTWEWCADFWGTAFTAEPAREPTGPAGGSSRVIRGGSFLCHAAYCNRYRVAARTRNTPDSSASNIGFRCSRPID